MQSYIINTSNPLPKSWKQAFKAIGIGNNRKLFVVVSPILAAHSALTRGYYALFQGDDCFECLSPHKTAA